MNRVHRLVSQAYRVCEHVIMQQDPASHSESNSAVCRIFMRTVVCCAVVAVSALTPVSAVGQESIPLLESMDSAEADGQTNSSWSSVEQRGSPSSGAASGLSTVHGQPERISVPIKPNSLPERTMIQADGGRVTLVVRDASLGAVLNAIAEQMNLNVVSSASMADTISITLNQVPLEDALQAILSVNGYQWVRNKNIIMVSSLDGTTKLSPAVDGRQVRVFHLDFVAASDIEKTVKGLLSPLGSVFSTEVDSADKLRHREELVVEDLPQYLARIEDYIRQADHPPAQVLIEAHVLQVSLRDDNRHGVNIRNVARLAGADITLQTSGIANAASSPAFFLNVDGTDVNSIIEVLQGTTDSKTLASPKVLAVNGQEARMQIGESLGYLTTTTTQTSTVQDVSFLDLGVVLTVTPVISRDGRILMTVKPEVSSGRINSATGLPDSETTEVESTVLLPSGHAMVIGGLIKEENTDQQNKLPLAGDIPVLGKLFQRRNRVKDRSEIIIVIMPRIVPYTDEGDQARHAMEIHRATTPLLDGPLIPVDRTRHEALLPNASQYCEPFGKGMHCFPTPPVAYSPDFPAGYPSQQIEFQDYYPSPPMPQHVPENSATPLPMATEFLPPVQQTGFQKRDSTIQRVSGVRGNHSGDRKSSDGWGRTRKP